MLSVITLCVITLCVIMLSIIILSVIMLFVIMLNVSKHIHTQNKNCNTQYNDPRWLTVVLIMQFHNAECRLC